jgi:hypothetical protein
MDLPRPAAPVLPAVQPVRLETVKWHVVSIGGVAMFALDAQGYESLSRNLAALSTWMGEATWQMDFYRRTRDGAQTEITK